VRVDWILDYLVGSLCVHHRLCMDYLLVVRVVMHNLVLHWVVRVRRDDLGLDSLSGAPILILNDRDGLLDHGG
jgi:hypothetical protein